MPWASRGLERAQPTPTRALGRPKTSFTYLQSEGAHAVRICQESNPDIPIHSPARYLFATAAGRSLRKRKVGDWNPTVSMIFHFVILACIPYISDKPMQMKSTITYT